MYVNYIFKHYDKIHIHGLVPESNNPISNALELVQSCTKPLISSTMYQIDGLMQNH